MTIAAPELVLHHYGFSNYSEKARRMLGFKGATWRSATIPPIAPKPDLTPLTGGYRRTPVLQIGADIWCDTRLIARELERRFPEPALFPPGTRGASEALAQWAEERLFRPIALHVSGVNAEHMPEGLHADRATMRGLPVPTVERVKAAAQRVLPQIGPQIAWIADMLSDGRPWILGGRPSYADFCLHHPLWFFGALPIDLRATWTHHAAIAGWMARVGEFGHGTSVPIAAADALAIAAAATPAPPRPSAPGPDDPRPGERISIRPDDYARDPVEGTLDFIDDEEVALRRVDPAVGETVVHFPRLRYELRRL